MPRHRVAHRAESEKCASCHGPQCRTVGRTGHALLRGRGPRRGHRPGGGARDRTSSGPRSRTRERWPWPQARASTCISSTLARRNCVSCAADVSTSRRARRCGCWVAMPTGQLLVWHARIPETTDCLHGCVGDGDGVGAQGKCLGEVGRGAQTAGDDEADVGCVAIEVTPSPGQRRNGRDRDVIAKQQRRSARAAAAAIEDDVVDTDRDGRVEVVLDALGRHLGPDGDTPRRLAHFVGETDEVVEVAKVGERRRRHCRSPRLEPADLGDPALHLDARQVPARSGLGALTELEVKGRTRLRPSRRPSRTWPDAELVEVARRRAPAPRAGRHLRPNRWPCRRASAPIARATFASSERAPKLMSDTKIGMSSASGRIRTCADDDAVSTASSSSSGRRANCAVTNWMESQLGKLVSRDTPSMRPSRGGRPRRGRHGRGPGCRWTWGSSGVPW